MNKALATALAAAVTILILQLYADDRSAILEQQALRGVVDMRVEFLHQREISRIVRACVDGAVMLKPVREAAVAALAVGPGTDAQQHLQPHHLADQQEPPQIEVPVRAPDAPLLLMVDPEHIGRHDADAAGLHLAQFLLPFLCRVA